MEQREEGTEADGLDVQYNARIRRQLRLNIVLGVAVALSLGHLAVTLLNRDRVPASETPSMQPGQHYRVDLLLVDGPDVTEREIEEMVKPMVMVLVHRMPTQPENLRIVVRQDGFFSNVGDVGGIAMYDAESDTFAVNLDRVRAAQTNAFDTAHITSAQEWAFLMGHEAFHLVQATEGEMKGHVSTAGTPGYNDDPIELSAFKEGVDVANGLPGPNFAYTLIGKWQLLPSDPSPYYSLRSITLANFADIRVHRQTTPRGLAHKLLHLLRTHTA